MGFGWTKGSDAGSHWLYFVGALPTTFANADAWAMIVVFFDKDQRFLFGSMGFA